MKLICSIFLTGIVVANYALAFDIQILRNNKEAVSRVIEEYVSVDQENEYQEWLNSINLNTIDLRKKSSIALLNTMSTFEKREAQCDLGLAELLLNEVKGQKLINSDQEFIHLLIFMRQENLIDDLFLKILLNSAEIKLQMKTEVRKRKPLRPLNLYTDLNRGIDLEKAYSNFKTYPNDIESCSIAKFNALSRSINTDSKSERDAELKKLNYLALINNVISLENFHRIEVLRKRQALDWNLYLYEYLEITKNAKDKVAKEIESTSDNKFGQQYVSRRDQLTQRGSLYANFDSTQIMLMSAILEKAAKRMDAKQVSLNFKFNDDPESETETYVLSPMEQYRISIKMIRKDLAELRRSDLMQGKSISYEDIITSAYETGFIKNEELNYVVRFEEFWNPTSPRWKTYANFAFNLMGTASFYLPAPYNILGAIGLVITESKIMNKPKADPDDSWNTII
ncbi:MAG: hypothetical protein AB7I27_03590 [Bacteriovoracaceae bacterium]